MKLKLIHILPVLILTAMFLSAFGYALNTPNESNFSVQAQDTAEPTTPPIVETVLVPVTGDDGTASNNNATLLVYVLIGIAGLAFLVAIVAVLTRANQAPSDRTHTH
jgi:hypothetical protein